MTLLLTTLLVVGLWVVPSVAIECACTPCHGTLEDVHGVAAGGDFSHAAALGSGPVVIFPDTGHDNAGWVGEKPYFDVVVDCTLCHNTNLPAIHGNDCATCHPTPYDTLGGMWNKGCQQGGCHAFYHTDSTTTHAPFEDPSNNNENDCSRCHDQSWAVPQDNCLNCHAAFGPGDVSPPTTTSDAQGEYDGPAEIKFSITDNGKVGVGRTFYKLDGGTKTPAGKSITIPATALGTHTLEFWSMDQSGNTQLQSNYVGFAIVQDNIPPVTTSNAQASYNQGAEITLTPTDNSTKGVQATYYILNNGPIQTGTKIVIPAPSVTTDYTLTFWSVDWSGNEEAQQSVTFTVFGGSGTLRLIWGDSDSVGSPCSIDPDADGSWSIGLVGSNKVIKSGYAGCPNWSGVNDVFVSVGPTAYWVVIDWWDSGIEDYNQTRYPNVPVTTSGQVVPLRY